MVDYVANRLADIGITDGEVLMAKNHDQMLRYVREGKVDWVQRGVFEALIIIGKSVRKPRFEAGVRGFPIIIR